MSQKSNGYSKANVDSNYNEMNMVENEDDYKEDEETYSDNNDDNEVDDAALDALSE